MVMSAPTTVVVMALISHRIAVATAAAAADAAVEGAAMAFSGGNGQRNGEQSSTCVSGPQSPNVGVEALVAAVLQECHEKSTHVVAPVAPSAVKYLLQARGSLL